MAKHNYFAKMNAWLSDEEGALERIMAEAQEQAAAPDIEQLTPAEIRWAKEELEEARHAIEVLGGQVENVVEYTLTDGQETLERTIVIIKKIKKTPTLYPRNNSQISKKPL